MSDFLDRYGEQLQAAQLRGRRSLWARARSARRTLLIALGALAIDYDHSRRRSFCAGCDGRTAPLADRR
jgi:hypothetical protein